MMHQREKVLRTIKGKEEVVDFVFGSGILTGNPPEINERKGYKIMRGFGFSIKFSNGQNKKPTYYALELWGNNAEHMARLGYEGQLIELSGRITIDKYTGGDGKEKQSQILTVERFTCLERKDPSSSSKKDEEQTTTPIPKDEAVETIQDSKTEEQSPMPDNKQTVKEDLSSEIEEVVEVTKEFDDIPF